MVEELLTLPERRSAELPAVVEVEKEEKDFFKFLDDDLAAVERDAKKEANTVHGFEAHPSAVEPWLRRTGIVEHNQSLQKDEIHGSTALPKDDTSKPELFFLLEVMQEVLQEAHS